MLLQGTLGKAHMLNPVGHSLTIAGVHGLRVLQSAGVFDVHCCSACGGPVMSACKVRGHMLRAVVPGD